MELNEMRISEKVSYIKGLAEGLGLDGETDEGRVINAIIDVLGDIAAIVEDIDECIVDVQDDLSELEDSVSELEDSVYGEMDYDEDDDESHGYSGEDEMYETVCPQCGAAVVLDFNTASKGIMVCPNCGTKFELEFSDSLDDEDSEE